METVEKEFFAVLIPLIKEATIFLRNRNNGFAGLAASQKKSKKEKKAPAPTPEPEPEPSDPAPTPAPEPVVEKKDESDAELQVLAVSLAKDFIQRFQKSEPDGMTRIRVLLRDKFGAEAIKKLTPEQKKQFMADITALMVDSEGSL